MQPSTGVPAIAGRTPIACLNCASAKTGCDKTVPCSRCAEKNLPCEARFARRQAKIGARSKSFSNIPAQQQRSSPPISHNSVPEIPKQESEPPMPSNNNVLDPQLQGVSQAETDFSMPALQMPGGSYGTPPNGTLHGHGMDTMCLDNDMEVYHDFGLWNSYPPDIDSMFPGSGMEAQMSLPSFIDMGTSSSASDAMASTSMDTSLSTHTRSTSIASHSDRHGSQSVEMAMPILLRDTMVPEFEVVVAAEAAWPLARCNRPIFSGSCPRTAIVHLENLEQHSKDSSTWKLLDHNIATAEVDHKYEISVVPLNASSRDRILAITQGFLHTALETHRGGLQRWRQASIPGGFNFLVLPPSRVLEYFLRSYVLSLAPYYTLVHGGTLDPNEVMLNNQASTLLLLLAIAYGAAALPTAEARCLTAGLTETCRISLFHIIEKDVELSADPVVLRCALLFTILGAWSGDAWHMNIAMGQRGMYLAMLKHAGMLEPAPPMNFSNLSTSTELIWREWQQREGKSRLVYNWVMVDQELSLFHDTAPILSITELETPMPGSEALWLAKDSSEWLTALQQQQQHQHQHASPSSGANGGGADWMNPNSNSLGVPPLTPSLCDLFQDMLHDNINRRYDKLSPLQLKLLLHPLQSLLCHLRQVLSCFSDFFGSRRGTRTVTKASTLLRLEEVQSLLQNWYELCLVHAKNDPTCPVTRANLVLYHLISLNALTSFPEIERLARKESFDGSSRELSIRHKRCIHQPEEATIHCGQIIRLICSMPREGRPHWWSAAIYRAALILWVDSLSRMDQNAQRLDKGQIFAIDSVMLDDPAVVSYLWSGEGIPVLTKVGAGMNGQTHFKLLPDEILGHSIELLGQGVALRVSDGIKRKLQELRKNWSLESTVVVAHM
ncbi:uncharacterized protein LY89DRAFT_581580 [Mollisia scopiformis]|uniref:Zn(2)-C6 fungal-type domain-containing protein n=1 Tax=Mollisia scopiformis TaxID=149040 RepID=A0A194XGE7_MOLSC|nr:uncharacterized protein LY89DRAFT_581580 [Mollisia scopiformis]KUJ19211.1 hypothetical protein LY89DRAFT_581580 [Mollisia scopiformis]